MAARTSASVSCADAAGLLGAGGQDLLQRGLVAAQLLVALADGREPLHDGLGGRGLEVAVAAGVGHSASTCSGVTPRATAWISMRFVTPGLSGARTMSLPESVTARLNLRRTTSGSSST